MMVAFRDFLLVVACMFLAPVSLAMKKEASPRLETSMLSFNAESAKNRPVTKVITLLKDMLKQLETEAEEDEAIYDKMACWCETNDKEKTKAISDAEVHIADLTTRIEELTASSARLNTEMKNLEKEIAANNEALGQATALREKQLTEFNAEEKDLIESVQALKAALTVLSKHHALIQIPRQHLLSVAVTLQHELSKHSGLLQGVLTHSDRRLIDAFVQSPEDYFDSSPTFKQAYAPQSGEIFGILKQMKETFETNLSDSQKEEMANQKAYEELKAAKEAEIAAGQAQLDTKTQNLAETDMKNAQAKQDIEDTKASLSADEQFLMMLKEKCSMTDKEWEERQKTRQLEMEAVSKAIAVLSSDDAHDLFTKTFNPALVQLTSSAESQRRDKAAKLLRGLAMRLRNPRLATLAEQVQLDAFTRVKEAIDKMVVQLQKEKEDEIKHKDFCVSELNQNQLDTEKFSRDKEDLVAKLADLEMTIKTLGEEMTNLKSEIAELQVQLKRAGEDREKQNKEFQDTIADQRATQKLLSQALTILKGFYDKKETSLMQRHKKQEPAGPPPPPGFQAYEKNAASGGVLSLIQQIISDAKAMEAEAIHDEDAAQKAYEVYVKDTNASIDSKNKEIVHKSKAKAKAEGDQVEAMDSKEAVELQLTQLANSNADTRKSCDFVLNNFDIRQTARDEEIEALKQAKAILSGAKFTELLQTLS